ncbi:pyrimidine-specific ribonucleoside hydrolase RihA-like [Anopheles darlingi]|uniref:pyrimidine-specific ribonucleoside hydrolase RihA-like n=1 Tax=Anopheles darlingi TaxID=43151 RepID=UPI0021003214|nr:pyrimidine-specific ribonucleoside hydrolase RihA-like [Anopheles darlingi]
MSTPGGNLLTVAVAVLLVALALGSGGIVQASKCPRSEKSLNGGVRRVILDLDAGGDDAWALVMLLANEERHNICLQAITCTHGNAAVADVALNVLRILEAMNRLDVPVYLGATEPLIRPQSHRNESHYFWGQDGFGDAEFDTQPSTHYLEPMHAVQKMYELFTLYPHRITLLAVGPLTNVALLFKMYPEAASKMEALYILGGNRHGVGNTAVAAEFNFFTDPEAANIVLNNAPMIVNVFPWETVVTLIPEFSTQWRFETFHDSPNPAIQVLNRVESIVYAEEKGWTPCDMFVATVFLNSSIVQTRVTHRAEVELSGRVTRGMMAILHHIKEVEQHNVAIIDAIDAVEVRRMLLALKDVQVKEKFMRSLMRTSSDRKV